LLGPFFYPPDSDHFRDASRSTDSRWDEATTRSFLAVDDENEKCIKEAKAKIHFHSANQDAELSLFPSSSIRSSASGISAPRLWGYRFRPLSSHLFGGAALTESKSSAMFFQSSQKKRKGLRTVSVLFKSLDVSLACCTL
jgi:hypothetical protein